MQVRWAAVVLACAASVTALQAPAAARLGTPYERLSGVTLASAASGGPVALTSLWRDDERCAVEFLRHFG